MGYTLSSERLWITHFFAFVMLEKIAATNFELIQNRRKGWAKATEWIVDAS